MPEPVSEQWHKAALKWTDLESVATLYEDTKSAVFSQMVLKQNEKSIARAETVVRASEEWKEHLDKIAGARKLANLAKVEMEYRKMQFWESMSADATHRLEAKL